MARASDNINTVINTALPSVFASLKTTGDRLQLLTVRLWPLQDDITRVAPYVAYGPYSELGHQQRKDVGMEIGGGIFYWTYYRVTYGSPQANSREQAWSDIEDLGVRVEEVLQQNYTLGDAITPGGSEQLSGNNPYDLVIKNETSIFGGDNEFYGIGRLFLRYSYERKRNW